jgi:hypothetical protein
MHIDGSPGRLIRTFGRRGVFLIMFGLVYVAIGVSAVSIPSQRFSAIPVMGPFLDNQWWGVMWIAAGVIATVNGAYRSRSAADGPGFVALLCPPGVWSIFYATSAVTWFATSGEFGRVNSISGAAVWALVWLVVTLVSGWPDADAGTRERR